MSETLAKALEYPVPSALRVGLTLGGIVLAAVVIFALGVMEGSRVAELTPAVAPPPSALPTEDLTTQPAARTTAPTSISPDRLTFYDRLSGVAPSTPVALPDGQAPAEGFAPAASPSAANPLAPPPASQAPTEAVSRRPAAGAPAERAAAPSTADAAAQIRKLAGKGRFTVQLAAVSERAAAAETAALMKRNGFTTVTVKASIKGKTYYRIRFGSFPSKQAAAQAAGVFRSSFGLNAIPAEN